MKYKTCIFDLYGTLADIHTDEGDPVLWQDMAETFRGMGADYSPEELKKRYFRLVEEQERVLLRQEKGQADAFPEIQVGRVFHRLLADRGVSADEETIAALGHEFRSRSRAYIRLYDGAKELLSALRESGRRVFLLTNAQRLFTAEELDLLGISQAFDGIYISSDCGYRKPDVRFFRQLLDREGIDPSTAVMIGNDGECDIRGAQKAGLKTLYIRSNISPREPLPSADMILEQMDLARVQTLLTQA